MERMLKGLGKEHDDGLEEFIGVRSNSSGWRSSGRRRKG